MTFEELRKLVRNRPVFTPDDLHANQDAAPHEFVQLSLWAKSGKIIRIRKGLYTLPDSERRVSLHPLWLANIIYEPSYVSLEYALSHHSLIPEAVGQITSVSTRKTKTFHTPFGVYSYHNLGQGDFFGFIVETLKNGEHFWIATPEKAILDFLHLRVDAKEKPTKELFIEGYRFQNLESVRPESFRKMVQRTGNARTKKLGKFFGDLLRE